MSPIACAALLCHEAPTSMTLDAMERAARTVLGKKPDVVVLVSRRRAPGGFAVSPGPFVVERIGASAIPLPLAQAAALVVEAAARKEGLAPEPAGDPSLAPAVALRCLVEAGWRGETLAMSFPIAPSHSDCQAMGRAIAGAAESSGGRWALVLSGQLGRPSSPDTSDERGHAARAFDEMLVAALRDGRLREAVAVEPTLRQLAGEDVIDCLEIGAAALGFDATGHAVLSYEAPRGVGHLVAMIHDETPEAKRPRAPSRREWWRESFDENVPFASSLASMAREAICARLAGTAYRPQLEGGEASLGVFVALRDERGLVRIARGSLGDEQGTLVEEIVEQALSACTQGMAPLVDLAEMDTLTVEISVLRTLEPIDNLGVVDPARDGILVEQGARRGMFLPHLPMAGTAEQQLTIACESGRIDRARPFDVYRMIVDRLVEPQADA